MAPVEGVTMDVYMRAIVPIGALFSVVLWLGNTAYLYLSVSFIQMLKASYPSRNPKFEVRASVSAQCLSKACVMLPLLDS